MKFYTLEKLGPKQSVTPEGFLLCQDVPIARTGEQIYGPGETPIEAGDDGLVHIMRDAEEVFRPATVRSAEGKDVVNDHPPESVTPLNWKGYSVGHLQNVRRGDGVLDDYLFGDLLIKDPDAIDAVRGGKRQVSCGYNAEYEATGPGRGRQYDIIINHVALVDQGRCGPRCSIGDHAMAKKKSTVRDRIMRLLSVDSPEELEEKLSEEIKPEPATPAEDDESEGALTIHNHIHPAGLGEGGTPGAGGDDGAEEMPAWFKAHKEDTDRRFKMLDDAIGPMLQKWAKQESEEPEHQEDDGEMEEEFEEEAPPGTGDKARRATDSKYLEDSFQETVSLAEIVAPGIQLPTFDGRAKPRATFDAICALRRRALERAYVGDAVVKEVVDGYLRGRPFVARDLKPAGLRLVFSAAATAKRKANDAAGTGTGRISTGSGSTAKAPPTLAEINKKNADFWKTGIAAA